MASSPSPDSHSDSGDTARHLRNVLGAFAVAVHDLLAEDAGAHAFNPAEHAAIILAGALDGMSQEDLQIRLGLSQPGTTRLVDRLAARGLLVRTPGPDRRTNALRLTPAGSEQARHALDRRRRLLGPLIANFGEEDQRTAARLIDRMLTTLIQSGRSPGRTCRLCDQRDCRAGDHRCPVHLAHQPTSAGPRP